MAASEGVDRTLVPRAPRTLRTPPTPAHTQTTNQATNQPNNQTTKQREQRKPCEFVAYLRYLGPELSVLRTRSLVQSKGRRANSRLPCPGAPVLSVPLRALAAKNSVPNVPSPGIHPNTCHLSATNLVVGHTVICTNNSSAAVHAPRTHHRMLRHP